MQYYLAAINFVLALVWWDGISTTAITVETAFHFAFALVFAAEVSLRFFVKGGEDFFASIYDRLDLVTV